MVPDRLRAAMQMLGALLQWEQSPAPFGMVCGVRGTPRRDTDGPMRRRPFVLVRRHLGVRRPLSRPMLPSTYALTHTPHGCTDVGGFAMWGGLFSTFDCALLAIRQKDDPINPIMSGAITGGVLAARGQSAEPAAACGVWPSHQPSCAGRSAYCSDGFPGTRGRELLHASCCAHLCPLCVRGVEGGRQIGSHRRHLVSCDRRSWHNVHKDGL